MMLLATSSVVFSSCSKDDDKDEKKEVNQEQNQNSNQEQNQNSNQEQNQNSNQEQNQNSNQEQNQNSNQEQNQEQTVEKFTVTIDLNGEKIELGTSTVGQNITVDFDEVVKRSEFDGYEVLSITKDGVEVSGKQEVSANSEYKAEVIKCCAFTAEIPAKNKVLYGVKDLDDYQPTHFWLYSYKTYLKYVYKIGTYTTNTWYDLSEKNKGLLEDRNGSETELNLNYLLKNDGKYYVFSKRYTKSDKTVKGYKTEWVKTSKIAAEDDNQLVINESAKYESGIITIDQKSYAYDGTYLYEICSILEEIDGPTYATGKSPVSFEEAGLTLNDVVNNEYQQYTATKDNDKVNVYKLTYGGYRYSYFALYDWDGDGKISSTEINSTWVVNVKDDTYFTAGASLKGNCGILPDKTYQIYGYRGELNDQNSFIYKDWVVFYFDIEAAREQ